MDIIYFDGKPKKGRQAILNDILLVGIGRYF